MFQVGKTYTYSESDGEGGTYTEVFRVDHMQGVRGQEGHVAIGVCNPGPEENFDYYYTSGFEEYGWREVES